MPECKNSGGRVLLAEDDPMVAGVVVEILTDLGFQSVMAPSGPEAIAAVKSSPRFDLVITDISMPGATGRELCAAVRDRYPTLPVLYVTGYDAADLLSDVDSDAHLGILQKPFGPRGLEKAIAALVN